MEKSIQSRWAEALRARHFGPPVLLLPNAWDPLSAAVFITTGFDMLATTSGGVAWALGYPDGEVAPWEEVVAATKRIVRATQVPVTADIEAAYAVTAGDVQKHVGEIIDAGVAGINLEDSGHNAMRSAEDAVSRVHAARQAAQEKGVPIVINARCDLYHVHHSQDEALFEEVAQRCRAYLHAGADCVYPFGLRDPTIIERLAKALKAPINITGRPGMPSAKALERIGVARVTIAAAPCLVAMTALQKLARDLRASGDFDCLKAEFGRADAQKFFSRKG